jgi:hypothetical protein
MAESSGGWEELIGGNLLNKLGALVLVIGIALFLSFSFANMGPSGRAATAAAVSIATLAGGIFTETKERYRNFAGGIIATGWAGLYFTSYAMYALPAAQVIDNPVIGTLLMIAVALGMVGHSLRYRVQSLTALAFGCIFAALALSPMNTFAAISLIPLAAAMLYLARRFDWHALALFAAGGTYTVFLTRPATGAPLANIQAMLVVFWALFEGFDLLRIKSGKAADLVSSRALYALNALAGLAASAALWNRMAPDSMWLFAAGAAVLYLASAWIRFALDGETYYEFSLVISAVLTALAIFDHVPGMWKSVGIALEAEILFLAAHYLRVRATKALSGLGFAFALASIEWSGSQTLILNSFLVRDFTPPLAVLAGMFYTNRFLSKDERGWSYFASAFVAFVAAAECRDERAIGPVLLGLSVILFELGVRKRMPEFQVQSYILAPISALTTLLTHAQYVQKHPELAVAAVIGGTAIVYYCFAARFLRTEDPALTIVRYGASGFASVFALVALWMIVPVPFVPIAFAALALLTLEAGLASAADDVTILGRAISVISAMALLYDAPESSNARIGLAAVIAATHLWIRFRARTLVLSAAHGMLSAFIIAATLWAEVSGRLLTLSWSLEGIVLLAIGFIGRDRWLRLTGLGFLLGCIAKVFLYDLRNLPTEARILSFIGLGVILLAVSWIYTRFKEQLQRFL